eukprot:90784-Chlamydomonas_euryale.AAC.1
MRKGPVRFRTLFKKGEWWPGRTVRNKSASQRLPCSGLVAGGLGALACRSRSFLSLGWLNAWLAGSRPAFATAAQCMHRVGAAACPVDGERCAQLLVSGTRGGAPFGKRLRDGQGFVQMGRGLRRWAGVCADGQGSAQMRRGAARCNKAVDRGRSLATPVGSRLLHSVGAQEPGSRAALLP